MLAMRFGDTDVDKDGNINAVEFELMGGALPRRHGLALGAGKGAFTAELHTTSRKAMFDVFDLRQGPVAGWASSSSRTCPQIMSFGDVDVDTDSKINAYKFDYLREKVAAMPHRFGFAYKFD